MKKLLSILIVLMSLNAWAGYSSSKTGSATSPFTIGSSDGISISGSDGIGTISGTGNTNNNSITMDFETLANRVNVYGNNSEISYTKSDIDAFDSVQLFNGVATYTNNTTEAGKSWGTVYTVIADTNDYFYCGDASKFSLINFSFETVATSSTLVFEYSTGSGAWSALTVTDGTSSLTGNGSIIFTQPEDWATDTVNSVASKYWVRFHASAISGTPTAYLTIPTNNFLQSFYSNYIDTVPALSFDQYGNVLFYTATPRTNYAIVFGRGCYFLSSIQTQKIRATRVSQSIASNVTIAENGYVPVTSSSSYYIQVSGNGAARTLGADPAIQSGGDTGDTIVIIGTSDSNTITIKDNMNTQNISGADVVLGAKDSVEYRWDGTDWIQNRAVANV